MLTWRKICCPVDFSAPSRLAMEAASEVANRFGAELTLLHVTEPGDAVLVSPPELFRSLAEEKKRRLESWGREAVAAGAPKAHQALRSGEPAPQIVRFASDEQFDLIVIGTHGRTGVKRAVFGSVAEAVVRTAPCPVLTVRPPATEP